VAIYPHAAGDEHLHHALQQLAYADGSLQERLAAAAQSLIPLRDDDYGPEIQHRIRILLGHLTGADVPPHAPGLRAATSLMNDEQARRFMDHIIDIAVAAFRVAGAAQAQRQG
jgi:hypothetical protein